MYVLAVLLILLGLITLIIALLYIPVKIEFHVFFGKQVSWRWRIKYLFDLVNFEIANNDEVKTSQKPSGRKLPFFDLIGIKGLVEQILLLIKRLFHAIKFRHIRSDIRYSLGEDTYTGEACGYIYAVLPIINVITGSNLQAQPVFEDELKVEGYLQGNIEVRPAQVAFPCMAFICSKPARQAGGIMMKKQWKKR